MTGIVLLNGMALLFGDAVFACLYEELSGANDAHHRKDTERHGQIASAVTVVVKLQGRFQRGQNRLGEIVFLTAATAIALGYLFHDLCGKENGIDDLYNRPLIGMFYTIIKSEKFRR